GRARVGVEDRAGAAGAAGRPQSPTRLALVDGAEPQWATTWLDDADELARELIYRFTDGAELRRGPAPMAATVFEVPAPPPSARITLRLDAELARALGVKAVEATFTDIDGGVLRKTWGPDQFDSDWTLRVPTPAGGTARRAAGQVRYRVSFGEGPEYLSPEGPVTGPGTLTFDFFGAVRFTAEPEAFTQVQSFTPTLTEPVEITGETGGADHPSVTVRIPGDAAGAPLPGAEPHVRWCVRWDLGHANATVTRGSGPRQRVELEAPLGVKTFTFLPVWADGDVELRRLRLTYRSLEEGPDWRIEGDPQSLDLKPGDGPRSFAFPVRCPTRATVFFNGRAITRRGSLPVPDTTVAGTSIPVGASEPWLSIRVNAELVDWSRYDSVRVKLRRDGEPAAAGTLDFTAEDGPRVWGFFGASAADRRYDLEATYRGPGTSGTFRITGQTSELFTLPASPESA
ncbi:MAG: hypothetical protein AAGM22_03735, partial [Acidobacteriota bacterium]